MRVLRLKKSQKPVIIAILPENIQQTANNTEDITSQTPIEESEPSHEVSEVSEVSVHSQTSSLKSFGFKDPIHGEQRCIKESEHSQGPSQASQASHRAQKPANIIEDVSQAFEESLPNSETQQESRFHIGLDEQERKSTARRIFSKLALENAEKNPGMNEVLEPRFKEALISAGISDSDKIDAIIKDMEEDGLQRLTTELDGVLCDILRKSEFA